MAKQFVEMEEARKIILDEIENYIRTKSEERMEEVPIWDSVGRVCGRDVCAMQDQPPFDRSPLDGFALRSEDTMGADREHPISFSVKRKVYAGDDFRFEIAPGEAVRIMTGAGIPYGADCVIRQEDVEYQSENTFSTLEKDGESSNKEAMSDSTMVTIYQQMKHHDNICDRGEDIKSGTLILTKGDVVTSAHGAVLAGQGYFKLPCFRPISIGMISTGSELVERVEDYNSGKIYNSNGPMIVMRLKQFGMQVLHECCEDRPDVISQKIKDLLISQDVVITTGGVSVGEKDYLPAILKQMGAEILFQGVAMKPGSPMMAAALEGKLIIALSGNPFAAAATLELIALPGLLKGCGRMKYMPQVQRAVLKNDFPKASKHGRRFIRAAYESGTVTVPENHSSGSVAGMIGSNCLIDIPAGMKALTSGEYVDVIMLLADNNMEAVKQCQKKRTDLPPILCISGAKNSGKTTLMEMLISRLREKGLQVAAIKHDGHDFEPDVPGTDSYRFRHAGAFTTLIYSKHKEVILHQRAAVSEMADFEAVADNGEALFQKNLYNMLSISDIVPDIVLAEGLKNSSYTKIETFRQEGNRSTDRITSAVNPQGLLATYGNIIPNLMGDITHYNYGDEDILVKDIEDWILRNRIKE